MVAKMKKRSILYLVLFFLVLFLLARWTTQTETGNVTGGIVATVSEDGYQDITLSYGKSGYSFNYILTPNTVQAGIPVRVTADVNSLKGCYRYVQVPEYDISQYISNFGSTFEFTPEQAEEVLFTCSMGMGRATLTVI